MAAFVKFYQFSEDLSTGVHDLHNDTLEVYLSNTAPDVAADAVFADLAQISTGSGYSGPVDVQNAVARTLGVTSVTGVDVTITASGGPIGPYRYVVLRNTTPTSPADPLIGYWDKGSPVTLADGESDVLDFGSSLFTVT